MASKQSGMIAKIK